MLTNQCYVTPAFSGCPKVGIKSKVAASPRPSRGPTSGRNCYPTPAFLGLPSKGDKIKGGCIGGKDKTLDVQPKRVSPKNFRRDGVPASKNTLKTPPRKGGGCSKTPHAIGFLGTPPPCILLQQEGQSVLRNEGMMGHVEKTTQLCEDKWRVQEHRLTSRAVKHCSNAGAGGWLQN